MSQSSPNPPPAPLDYQSQQPTPTPPDTLIFALDPLGLPKHFSFVILFNILELSLFFPTLILIISALTGILQKQLFGVLLAALGFTALTSVLVIIHTWLDLNKLWPTYRVMVDQKTLTRTAANRKTLIIRFDEIKKATYSKFTNALLLVDRQGKLLIIPNALFGIDEVKKRIQLFTPIQPGKFSIGIFTLARKIRAVILIMVALTSLTLPP